MLSGLRVLKPTPWLYGFYDGRVDAPRRFSQENWFDDGAFSLGVCSYALVHDAEAIVYDTHISIEHAKFVRDTLEAAGVRTIQVVLSHWHADHVAGNAVFEDCEIISHRLTLEELVTHREALERDLPPICPLVLPNRIYEDDMVLSLGPHRVELRHVDVHSLDATCLFLPDDGLLLAGDCLEDPITYVMEPGRLGRHLADLARIKSWMPQRIFPNHGDPQRISAGGYGAGLIDATIRYVERLLQVGAGRQAGTELREFMADSIAEGAIGYFAPYEGVHRRNLSRLPS